jgi:hypothetical protein
MTGERDDDRLDAAGWWQLGGMAALGVAAPLVFGLLMGPGFPRVAVVVLALALGVVLPVVQLRSWWARGGRAAVLETRSWVVAGRVPDTVPEDAWRPRVRRYGDDVDRAVFGAWAGAVLAVVWVVLAATGQPADWLIAAGWAVTAGVRFVQIRGERAAVRRLLASRTPVPVVH